MIVDNSETIDNYGKLGFKIVFGVLALINIAIAVFMLLLCFCSGKCCTKCCCCRCICKLFTHLLWNILAILMIIVFLVGSLFSIIGKIGEDGMNVISYIVSEDNIGEGGDNILVDQIGDSVKYLRRCLILNGSIENDLDLGQDQLQNLDGIRDAEAQIENAKREFEKNKQMVVYNQAMYHLGNITENLKSEYPFGFILYKKEAGNPTDYLEFNYLLNLINENEITKNKKEKFDFSCSLDLVCDNSGGFSPYVPDEQQKCFHPTKCIPSQRSWINEDSTLEFMQQ